MSDDLSTDGYANLGVTLPNGVDAIYNAGLSPLFFARVGRGSSSRSENATMWRGNSGYFWPSNSKDETSTYFFEAPHAGVRPSGYWMSNVARSLRCLVSTNNR